MKRTLLVAIALLGGSVACAAPSPEKSAAALVRLLNSRAAGSPKDYAEAAMIVAEDAKAGRPLQQFVIALVAEEADAPPAARLSAAQRREYLDQSRGRIKALAEKRDNAMAWYLLSMENNDLRMLKRAADGGNVQALNALGTITLTQALNHPGIDGPARAGVIRKSCDYFRRAAEQNDANGLYNLGMCYLHAYGVARDREQAFACFRKAAEVNHPEAINNIGGFYRDGIVVAKDPALATRWFRRSAELGNVYGQLNYALALQRGEGVERDAVQAVRIFKAAAESGNVEAMNAYGMCLFQGDGVEQDVRAAVDWYKRAAAAGFPAAMENLAVCCGRGLGGLEKSERAAAVWKVRARAARGDGNARIWLEKNGESLR
ncbi:MAG: tetratricopeptide repeat protein [Kiritimatiellia bacterium]